MAGIGLSPTDLIAYILTPASVATFGWIKYLSTDKEKHIVKVEADLEKEQKKIEADVEKERIKCSSDVEKERERSHGGEAVLKIWKEFTLIQIEIKKLSEAQSTDYTNDLLISEIMRRLQEDVNRLMNVLFENLPKK